MAVNNIKAQTLPEPVASYSFDDNADDAIGNYDGILEKDAEIVDDDERGYVLGLIDSGYVSIPSELAEQLENFSFTAWVNFGGTVKWAGLMGMGKSVAKAFPYWDFHIRGDLKTMSFYSSVDVVWPSDGCSKVVNDYVFPNPPEWVHVAFSFEFNVGAVVYINGVAQTTSNWNDIQEFDVSPSMLGAEVIYIGRDAFNQGTLTNTKIDDFNFYDVAITEEEVVAIYESVEEGVGKNDIALNDYLIAQNYPNPFKTETTLKINLRESGNVKLSVNNVNGQEIAVLVNGFRNAGSYSESFNAANLKSGVYFYRLELNGHSITNKMILMN